MIDVMNRPSRNSTESFGRRRRRRGRAEQTRANSGAATMINKRCWIMWSLKYSMSKTPMTDCVAMNVTMSPARNDTVRFADQLRDALGRQSCTTSARRTSSAAARHRGATGSSRATRTAGETTTLRARDDSTVASTRQKSPVMMAR